MSKVYVIGSLRHPYVPQVAHALRLKGHEVFDDWHGCGPEADDYWQQYETARGRGYREALQGELAQHSFEFDKRHLDAAEVGVLVLPAGKSAHLELGYMKGCGKRSFVLLEDEAQSAKLPEDWRWLAGVYEGEGSITRNGKRGGHGLQLTVTMKDADVICRLRQISGRGNINGPYAKGNPNWSVMWRWAVRKREDVLYVLSGIWDDLGERRREQALSVLGAAGLTKDDIDAVEGPKKFRFDLMYLLFDGVCGDLDELLRKLDAPRPLTRDAINGADPRCPNHPFDTYFGAGYYWCNVTGCHWHRKA